MSDIILPGQLTTPPATIITPDMINRHPELEKLVPTAPTEQEKQVNKIHEADTHKTRGAITVPDIYFWVNYDLLENPTQMTCAFKWQENLFGETWKVEKEW